MKQFAHNWHLPHCQCTETCSHVSFIQNDISTPVPGVSIPVENRSCPESTRCCSQCVLTLSWCQSVVDGLVMAEWLRHWLQQWSRWVSLRFWGPRFNTCTHLMKQFAHNWYLLFCKCAKIYVRQGYVQDVLPKAQPGAQSSRVSQHIFQAPGAMKIWNQFSDRWIPHSRCCENPARAKVIAGFSRYVSAGFTDLNPTPRGLSL